MTEAKKADLKEYKKQVLIDFIRLVKNMSIEAIERDIDKGSPLDQVRHTCDFLEYQYKKEMNLL